jgi:hypothetical protein
MRGICPHAAKPKRTDVPLQSFGSKGALTGFLGPLCGHASDSSALGGKGEIWNVARERWIVGVFVVMVIQKAKRVQACQCRARLRSPLSCELPLRLVLPRPLGNQQSAENLSGGETVSAHVLKDSAVSW